MKQVFEGFTHPFCGLETEYLQNKIIFQKQHGNGGKNICLVYGIILITYMEPIEHLLGREVIQSS